MKFKFSCGTASLPRLKTKEEREAMQPAARGPLLPSCSLQRKRLASRVTPPPLLGSLWLCNPTCGTGHTDSPTDQEWRHFGTQRSLLSQNLFISFAPRSSLHCAQHVYVHTYRLYMNYRETFLHISERCEVLTGYLSLGRRSGGDWTNSGHWAERFTVCFWTGSGSSQLLPCFVTYRISWGGLYYRYNTVIVLQTNYIIIIVTCK